MSEDQILTIGQVAELLQVDPRTVKNWIARGRLKASRPGGQQYRIRRSAVDQLLDDTDTEGTGE